MTKSNKSNFIIFGNKLIKEMIVCGMKERKFTMNTDFDIIIRDRKKKART